MKKIILILILTFILLSDITNANNFYNTEQIEYLNESVKEITFPNEYSDYIKWLSIPWTQDLQWNKLIIIGKNLLYEIIQRFPVLILILLLINCFKIIKDWDKKNWFKSIKYIIIWILLLFVWIYIINLISRYYTWHEIINLNLL